ncbi:hypothetical protein ASPSYDRAFT_72341 [Aspergillus sydowii CBS 593.65]|uniref:aldehyde dehydrogenase (NAD(+)) n=1 Tax=Aspergillus sydowii CBS 593.65 TaxID=1036612 RepID=A0A1L9T479_9EURO|nr:uncharacterized protein ASPSYDRAFT_72341 [Aspergillus sydowii CBS 593.65]OJJ54205.1 hypothetical protein ASPSYDRAFT_72341 [Aspergillus sydowii CBS 593.65]
MTTSTQTRHSVNPANRQPNPEVPVASKEDLDRAVAAARSAFKFWSKTSFAERRAALHAFSDALAENQEGFTQVLTQEQGKPLTQAAVEIGMSVQWLKGLSNITLPETAVEEDENKKIVQRYVPMGAAAGIVPWNFPVLLAIGKIAPAVYTGNAIIIKPSPFTPYCALKLGELAARFFPPGLIQVLSGNDDLGPWITTHPGIDKISFTGSTETGKRVMASSANTLKRVTLELGGNDPAIICDDVDIEEIVPKLVVLSLLVSSQICMMIKRLYVHEEIYDQFRDAFVKHTATLKVGDGTDAETFFGPVQNEMQYEKLKDLFSSIESQGLNPALGGTITESKGFFITPTIIDNPPEKSRVVQEEPFGPIIPLIKWSDEDDVLARANATDSGLGASVWSKDIDRANRMAAQLESGSVWVNSHFEVSPNVSIGGHKWSGIGSEWGVNGLVSYCNTQSLWLKK